MIHFQTKDNEIAGSGGNSRDGRSRGVWDMF